MKKIIVSLTAASLIVASAVAADKGIDVVTTGQAAVYYNTAANNATGGSQELFDKNSNSRANAGIQLNLDADLKNDFTFGSTLNYLGTLGLEKNLVNNTMQDTNAKTASQGINDDVYLSQIFIAKKIANTTVKLGRQELPLSLSPFAYSEDWNVFKNTFDAGLVINSDIKDTTLVGAYVGGTNGNGVGNSMATYGNLSVNSHPVLGPDKSGIAVNGPAYMLTAQNKSISMATVTASYYNIADIAVVGQGASIVWGDVAVADKSLPLGLKVGVQGGSIMPEASGLDATAAYGIKADIKPVDALNLIAAYTSVNDGAVAVRNTGGVKTPLYTQTIGNQDAIASDNDTLMLKAAYNTGTYGTVTALGTVTTDNSAAERDKTNLELIYTVKAGSVDYLAAFVSQAWGAKDAKGIDGEDIARVWARYNF